MIAEIALALLALAELGIIVVLVKRLVDPPVINPPSFVEELKGLLPGGKVAKPVVLPQEIVDYCDLWADDFARDDCKSRAHKHFAEYGDWNVVRTTLGREDGELR